MRTFIDITENIYISGMPIFYISKYLGLAPFQIKEYENNYKVTLSIPVVIVSYIFGITLVSLSIYGAINDMNLGKNALKMDTTQSMVITFFDVFIVMLIVILGIIRSPFKFSVYKHFLTLLKEIDSILNTTDSEKTRRNHFLGLSMILLFVISLLVFTICVEETTKGANNYIAFYFMYIIVFVFECQYWQSVQSIKRRFKRLNECFNFDDILKSDRNNLILRSKKTFTNKFSVTYSKGISEVAERKQFPIYVNELKGNKIIDVISVMTENVDIRQRSLKEYVAKLSEAHGKLFEAVNTVNEAFGFASLIIITSCLLHLVTTPYFLLLDLLAESSSTTPELILQFFWIVAHFCRLLIIIEPCHSACEEASNINPLVSRLLCSDIEEAYKKQLHMFSLQLVHRQIEFSAFGLCSINRPLLSAIAGAITTYLVILLQFR